MNHQKLRDAGVKLVVVHGEHESELISSAHMNLHWNTDVLPAPPPAPPTPLALPAPPAPAPVASRARAPAGSSCKRG